MVDEKKVQKFKQYVDYSKADIIEVSTKIKNTCEQIMGDKQSLREQMSSYEYEKNVDNKNGFLEGMRTLAGYYKTDLTELNEGLDELIEILSDITMTKIKIPGYVDKRDLVLFDAEKLVTEFKEMSYQTFENLDIYINEAEKSNVENLKSVIDSEYEVMELSSSVEKICDNMEEQFDLMLKSVEELGKINKVKR